MKKEREGTHRYGNNKDKNGSFAFAFAFASVSPMNGFSGTFVHPNHRKNKTNEGMKEVPVEASIEGWMD